MTRSRFIAAGTLLLLVVAFVLWRLWAPQQPAGEPGGVSQPLENSRPAAPASASSDKDPPKSRRAGLSGPAPPGPEVREPKEKTDREQWLFVLYHNLRSAGKPVPLGNRALEELSDEEIRQILAACLACVHEKSEFATAILRALFELEFHHPDLSGLVVQALKTVPDADQYYLYGILGRQQTRDAGTFLLQALPATEDGTVSRWQILDAIEDYLSRQMERSNSETVVRGILDRIPTDQWDLPRLVRLIFVGNDPHAIGVVRQLYWSGRTQPGRRMQIGQGLAAADAEFFATAPAKFPLADRDTRAAILSALHPVAGAEGEYQERAIQAAASTVGDLLAMALQDRDSGVRKAALEVAAGYPATANPGVIAQCEVLASADEDPTIRALAAQVSEQLKRK